MTEVSLREHLESRIQALEKATEVAARGMERRLEGMNEFRSQLEKQTRTFVDKEAYQHRHDMVCDRIKELESFKDKLDGKASASALQLTTILAVAALVIAVFGLLIELLT